MKAISRNLIIYPDVLIIYLNLEFKVLAKQLMKDRQIKIWYNHKYAKLVILLKKKKIPVSKIILVG